MSGDYEVLVEPFKKNGDVHVVQKSFASAKAREAWLDRMEAEDKLKSVRGMRDSQ